MPEGASDRPMLPPIGAAEETVQERISGVAEEPPLSPSGVSKLSVFAPLLSTPLELAFKIDPEDVRRQLLTWLEDMPPL